MATFSTLSANNNDYTLRLEVAENSTDVASNTSAVSWALYIDSTYARFEDYTVAADVVLDGVTVYRDTAYRSMPDTRRESLLLGSGTAGIAHNGDGGKTLNVSYSIAINAASYTPGNVSGSGSMPLTNLPRASSVSCGSFTLGSAGSICVGAASPEFTHTLTYAFGGASGTVAAGVGGGTVDWTPPLTLAAQIPNSTSGPGTITCTTYRDGSVVGSASCSFTGYVPAWVVPVVSAFTVSPVNKLDILSGVYVKGVTAAQYKVAAAGAYGAAMVGCTVEMGSTFGYGFSGTIAAVSNAGAVTPTVTVRDSRGRTTVRTLSAVTVYDYALPAVSGLTARRCTADGTASDTGTYLHITGTVKYSGIGNRNTAGVKARYKASGGSFNGYTPISGIDSVIGGDLAVNRSYVLEVTTTDLLGGSSTDSDNIATSSVAMNLRKGGKGIAVGKYAERDQLLDVAWDTRIEGDLTVDGAIRGTADMAQKALTADAAVIMRSVDTRSVNYAPTTYITGTGMGVRSEFKYAYVIGVPTGTYVQLVTFIPWSDAGGGLPSQMAIGNGHIYFRTADSTTAWGSWREL